MEESPVHTPRVATVADVASVAGLLDAFNREFDTPNPGKVVLTTRLARLLAGGLGSCWSQSAVAAHW